MVNNIALNMDCMEYLKSVPDKYFDLAVVDPPYGGGAKEEYGAKLNGGGADFESRPRSRFGQRFDRYYIGVQVGREVGNTIPTNGEERDLDKTRDIRHWDIAPSQEYFNELARVSKNQIIWGGNYFSLPATRCFLIWEKTIPENFTMAMCEYAWTSFNANAKIWKGTQIGDKKDPRFHPTQKPVALYEWIYKLFAKAGDKILDTHLGSGSSRIAAYNAGLDFTGIEIDKYYFDKQEERFAEHIKQGNLFVPETKTKYVQGDLFE